MVSPYLRQRSRSRTEALREMISERESELARSNDPREQARLRREIKTLLAHSTGCPADAADFVARQSGWEGSDNQDEKPGVAARS